MTYPLQKQEPHAHGFDNVRVLVIASTAFDRHTLGSSIARGRAIQVVLVTEDPEDAILKLPDLRPNIVLLEEPDSAATVATVAERASELPDTHVVVFDRHIREAVLLRSVRCRSTSYLTRSCSVVELRETLQRIASTGVRTFSRQIEQRIERTPYGMRLRVDDANQRLGLLTDREYQVLELICKGMTVREISQHMSLSLSTIDNHKSRLMKKLDVRKGNTLVRLGVREGVVKA